jgi:hypothetical protein
MKRETPKPFRNHCDINFWGSDSRIPKSRGGQAKLFLESAKSKFLDPFRCCKSVNFWTVPVRKSQIRRFLWWIHKSQIQKFLQNTAKLCLKTVLKVVFLKDFICTNLNNNALIQLEHYMLYCSCKETKFVFADGSYPKSAYHKKDLVR